MHEATRKELGRILYDRKQSLEGIDRDIRRDEYFLKEAKERRAEIAASVDALSADLGK